MNEQKIWFVSDVHFFHNNILKFCPATRHGETALEMNEYIVQAWNSKVHRRDIVYNLGDVSFGSVKNTDEVLSRLNGQIHLIYGNHDNMIRRNKGLRERFASVQDVKEIKVTLADGTKQDIVMNHFAQRVWNKAHYGAWHLYGHSHGDLESEPYFKSMDVGIDARPLGDMCPWSLDEIAEIMATRPALGHHSM